MSYLPGQYLVIETISDIFMILGRIVHMVEKVCQAQEPQLYMPWFLVVISPDSIW